MTQNEEKKANSLFGKYSNNASESDVAKIDSNLSGMKKGALAKIWDKVQILYRIVKNPAIPFIEKAPAIGALIYAISPIDAILDFIPGLGLADDAAVIAIAIASLKHLLDKYGDS